MPTPEELSLGTLNITVTSHGNDPPEAKFDLPDGSSVTREITAEGLAMKLGLGLGLKYIIGAHGGGYHADAVHFDGGTYLSIGSLGGSDSRQVSFSVWFKTSDFDTMWSVDSENSGLTTMYETGDAKPKIILSDNAGAVGVLEAKASVAVSDGQWHHWLYSADTNFSAGNKKVKIYLDDVDVTSGVIDEQAAFTPEFAGLPFFFGAGPPFGFFVGDQADPWFAIGQSLLDGSGSIPEATRRKFISADGKPVYLGADGSTPTGVAPTVFFSGTSAAFAVNKGTGGTFGLTGQLTNASTSPSD